MRIVLVPPVDRWPSAIALLQRPWGRVLGALVFGLGLWMHNEGWWLDATLILVATGLWPARRRWLLLAGAWLWLLRHTRLHWQVVESVAARHGATDLIEGGAFRPTLIVLVLAACLGLHLWVRARRERWLGRRPVLALLLGYGALLALASLAPLPGPVAVWLWAFLVVFGRYLWVLAFSLTDLKTSGPREALQHLGHYLPFWLGTSATTTPFGKGSAYLRKTEALEPEALAITQLKGLKLLFWAGLLALGRELFVSCVHGAPGRLTRVFGPLPSLDLPTHAEVFERSLAGEPSAWYVAWSALIARFLFDLLRLAVWGHVIVATCRMAGFGVLRNTRRPLESRTIAEFWNRYYYYFKELLAAFFFYPTYLRWFRRHPRLRTFFATLMAAGVGNVLFHFLRDLEPIVQLGPAAALQSFQVYAVYGLLLGSAIGLSQLRGRPRPAGPLRERLLAPLGVLAFYCVLGVFDAPHAGHGLGDCFTFLGNLIGVGA